MTHSERLPEAREYPLPSEDAIIERGKVLIAAFHFNKFQPRTPQQVMYYRKIAYGLLENDPYSRPWFMALATRQLYAENLDKVPDIDTKRAYLQDIKGQIVRNETEFYGAPQGGVIMENGWPIDRHTAMALEDAQSFGIITSEETGLFRAEAEAVAMEGIDIWQTQS